MSRVIVAPPETSRRPDGLPVGGWWHDAPDGERIICDLCPRECQLKPGDRGFCFVRQNLDGEMVLTTYGRSTGFCIDPIEKKPLNHFLPGTSVLSFGTAGCNLGCKFCQNWDISKSREVERLSEQAVPEAIAEAAIHHGCRSVAYTYNDPVVWAEYAIDTARACRARGVRNVAVTAGYISPPARAPFYEFMDAANVDLKSFSEEFYHKITYSHLQPVLDTLVWLKRETNVWFEITNLVIPAANDGDDEIRRMCDWILEELGPDVPLHFTAFHPDFRMQDRPRTPPETLLAARQTARAMGIRHCYVGNVDDQANQSTYCHACGGLLIERNWYELGQYRLDGSRCGHCGEPIPGVFETTPGDWGRRRLPVRIAQFARPLPNRTNDATEKEPRTMTPASEGTAARLAAQRPKLTDAQSALIHRGACELIAASVLQRAAAIPDPTLEGAGEKTVMGAFVTLKRDGNLRACCGALGRPMPLAQALQQASHRTATEDTRLPTLSPTELAYLELDVSLLFGFQEIEGPAADRARAVEVGRHGLQIQRGQAAGLLLPSVATDHDYGAEEFLRQVCRKAGLPSTAWQDEETIVKIFETTSIPGPFACADLDQAATRPLLGEQDLQLLAAHCARNLSALLQGATPSYYVPGCADGEVNGVALTLKQSGGESRHVMRYQMRPALPLQSTVYQMVESVAQALRSGRLRLPGNDLQIGLSVLFDPAMHGTVARPSLDGIDPRERAVLVVERNKSAWVFDPAKPPETLLDDACRQASVFQPEAASVFSLAVHSTEPSAAVSDAPQPLAGQPERPPAVAGRFYPGDAQELEQMVNQLLGEAPADARQVPAIMVPHAGLTYSGKIAAQVFGQVEIPDTVIVLSPKHTRLGVEWSVAPHDRWTLPGGEVPSDPALARELAEAIPGLELDAAAHQAEHGIEVELPLIARRNPNAKVVGVVIGAGDLQRCRAFADGLNRVLEQHGEPVLLVISSDMNHYASDAENRRLDTLAMEAMEQLDPAHLYQTVQDHNISMCGVLPAVIIMEALQSRGALQQAERVAYATSGEVNGDLSRVVGYCGMLLA